MPARWSPRSPRGSMRAPTAGAGWCASKTSTRRATSPARPRRSSRSSAAAACVPDEPPVVAIGTRSALYEAALAAPAGARAGPIPAPARAATSRSRGRDAGAGRDRATRERVYPGTCRAGLQRQAGALGRALRVDAAPTADATLTIDWHDRRLGRADARTWRARSATSCCSRADGVWAYQLAVVVDDADAGHHRRRARRGPGRQHARARSICSACSACRRRAICTRRWCCARRRREAVEADRRAAARARRSARGAARGRRACSALAAQRHDACRLARLGRRALARALVAA